MYAAANDYLLTSGLSEWEEQGGMPAVPSVTKHKVYFKSDGKLYTLNSSGAEQEVGSGASGGGSGGGDWTAVIDGALAPSEEVAAFVAGSNVKIIGVYVRCRVPGSSLSTIVDVNVDGFTIFTDQANRPELPFDGATDVAQSGEQDAVSVSAGSVVTVDIDQVAADAEDLSVTIVLQKKITGGATVDLTDQIDGVTSSFALPETPLIGTVSVFLNGVRQSK